MNENRCSLCSAFLSNSSNYCPACGLDLRKNRALAHTEEQWRAVSSGVKFYLTYLITLLPLFWVPEEYTADALIAVTLFDAILVIVFVSYHKLPWQALLRVDSRVIRTTFIGIGALPVFALVGHFYISFVNQIFKQEAFDDWPSFEQAGYSGWVVVLVVCLQPAIVEELAFRGLIQSKLEAAVRRPEAIFLTSLLFAIIHLSIFSMPYLFLVGLFLGWLAARSHSLLPGMIFHFFHNFIVLAIEFLF